MHNNNPMLEDGIKEVLNDLDYNLLTTAIESQEARTYEAVITGGAALIMSSSKIANSSTVI